MYLNLIFAPLQGLVLAEHIASFEEVSELGSYRVPAQGGHGQDLLLSAVDSQQSQLLQIKGSKFRVLSNIPKIQFNPI